LVQSTLASYQSQVRVFLDSLQPEDTLDDVLGARTIIPQEAPMLAGALPYQVVATGGRYAALPSTLRHAVTLKLYASALDRALDSPALSYATSLPALGSRRLGVTYVPASAADAQLIQSYQEQGASALPLYLIRVKPLIQVDGVTVASGSTVGMGQPQLWDVVLTDPQGFSSSPTAFSATAGDEMVFGVNGNGITPEVVLDRYAQVPPRHRCREPAPGRLALLDGA